MPFLAPIVAAVSTWWAGTAVGSFLATIGITGTMVLTAGLNVAAALIEKAFAKKSSPPGGVQFDKQYGEDVSRVVPIGLLGMAGHDCYVNTYGKSNKLLQQIYVVGDYYCDGMSRVSINGAWATLGAVADPDKGFPVTSGAFANLIWIKFFDGTQTVAADYLIDHANPSTRWTSGHVGLGVAFFLVSMTFDTNKNNSFPDFFFEFRGARLYDWRKDSTAGGSGPHRWGDYSTHEYSANPIVAEYNYRRGFTINDDLFCGMEMPVSDLPIDKFTAAANICDETVLKEDGSFEPRYQLSLLLDCTRSHGDNIESIMLSCGGMTIDAVDGAWPLVGSDQPVVATITDDDFVTGAPFQFQAKRSMSDLVNSVSGNSPDPDQLWSMVGYEPQISDTALVVDRRTRDVNIDFPMVPSARQAGQLAGIYLEENRWEATVSGMLRPRWQVLEAGDWVQYNSEKYGDHTFMMTESSLASLDADGPRNAQVSLQQRDGSIYDGILNPPVVIPAPAGEPDYLSELENFQATAIAVTGADGRKKPGIRASWNVITDETVSEIEIDYWPTAEPASIITKKVPADGTVANLTDGIVSDTAYKVDHKLVTEPRRTTAHSAPIDVTTLDVRIIDADVYLPGLVDEINQATADQLAPLNVNIRDIDTTARRVAREAMNQDAGQYLNQLQTLTQVKSVYGRITADYQLLVTAATGPASAIVQRLETLEATIPGLATVSSVNLVQLNVNTLGTTVTAQGISISGLNATVGNFSASSLFRTAVVATEAGALSTVGISVAATAGGATSQAALLLSALAGGDSMLGLVATKVYITDGTNKFSPFVFTSGVAYLENIVVGTLKFNQLSSNNNKLLLRGSGSLADISVFV